MQSLTTYNDILIGRFSLFLILMEARLERDDLVEEYDSELAYIISDK